MIFKSRDIGSVLHGIGLPGFAVALQVSTQIVAEVGRLVVADVLVEHAHVIGVVGHEPGKLVVSGIPCGEDFQVANECPVGHDDFLTPVTHQIAIPRGV